MRDIDREFEMFVAGPSHPLSFIWGSNVRPIGPYGANPESLVYLFTKNEAPPPK